MAAQGVAAAVVVMAAMEAVAGMGLQSGMTSPEERASAEGEGSRLQHREAPDGLLRRHPSNVGRNNPSLRADSSREGLLISTGLCLLA